MFERDVELRKLAEIALNVSRKRRRPAGSGYITSGTRLRARQGVFRAPVLKLRTLRRCAVGRRRRQPPWLTRWWWSGRSNPSRDGIEGAPAHTVLAGDILPRQAELTPTSSSRPSPGSSVDRRK